jgi:hypothetical protein
VSPEAPKPSDDDIRRQKMLAAIEEAVLNEDDKFFNEIVRGQTLLSPLNLSDYMNVKRKHCEDPVEERRWHDALVSYLKSLHGQEMSKEDADAINAIIQEIQFEDITSNEEEAEEPEVEGEKPDFEWDNDEFKIDLD